MGSIIALACALTWSFAVILLKRSTQQVHPYVLNFTKNFFGLVLTIPTLYFVEEGFTFNFAYQDVFFIALSGILGIGIADALLLKALSMIDASKLAVIECIYSPAVLILSAIFFAEYPSISSLLGIALVLTGVFLVATSKISKRGLLNFRRTRRQMKADKRNKLASKNAGEQMAAPVSPTVGEKEAVLGAVLGTSAVFLMAIGIIIVKPFFNDVPLFWIIFLRLFFGTVASFLLVFTISNHKEAWSSLLKVTRRVELVAACFIGTYISMMLWVASYKYQDAGIAAVLNQSATIFTVLFAMIFLKEKISLRTALAIVLALIGILVIVL